MKKMTGRILAALFAITVILSFSTIVFAEEAEDTNTVEAVTDGSENADTAADSEAEEADGAVADTAESSDDTNAASAEESEKKDEDEEDHSLLWSGIITLIVIVVVVVCVLAWVFKDKERALRTWRSFKSEFKKVVWADKHDTLKNTVLVIVAAVVIAAILGLVDYLFSLGIVSLGKLI